MARFLRGARWHDRADGGGKQGQCVIIMGMQDVRLRANGSWDCRSPAIVRAHAAKTGTPSRKADAPGRRHCQRSCPSETRSDFTVTSPPVELAMPEAM